MKKLLVLIVFVCVPLILFGQRSEKKETARGEVFSSRHQVQFGVGVKLLPDLYQEFFYKGIELPYGSVYDLHCESYNFHYSYRIKKGLQISADFVLTPFNRTVFTFYESSRQLNLDDRDLRAQARTSPNETPISSQRTFHSIGVSLTASVRWNYLTSRYCTLYGSAGVGVFELSGAFRFTANITPIGITFGRKVYGYLEVGSFSEKGILNGGVGYRF